MTAGVDVVVSEPQGLSAETLAQLGRLGRVATGPFDRAALLETIAPASVLMVRLGHRVDKQVLDAAPRLRAILSATTGLNHIDVDACRARNIEVISIRGERAFLATITSTAELALTLLLNLARQVVPAQADVLAGRWRRDKYRGISLRDLTLGLVGLGRLGCVMAGFGSGLGMRIIGTDPTPVDVPPFVDVVDLDTVLATSDCISLHATHDQGKSPLLGAAAFARMKRGTLLVNTARGELVDETAVLVSLESGHLGGYGADVVADETNWTDFTEHPLVRYSREHDNLLLTPHIGGATLDGLQRTEAYVVGKALRYFGVETSALPQ